MTKDKNSKKYKAERKRKAAAYGRTANRHAKEPQSNTPTPKLSRILRVPRQDLLEAISNYNSSWPHAWITAQLHIGKYSERELAAIGAYLRKHEQHVLQTNKRTYAIEVTGGN